MFTWAKDDIIVKVLHSVAGLGTQILISQKLGQNSEKNNNIKEENGILFDIGDGTCRDIIKIGYNLKFINIIAISHGHYDHCGGLWSLLGIQRMLGRTTPLTCIYPKGAKEISILIDNFNLVYKDSLPYKINEIQVSRMDKTNIEFDFLEIISWMHVYFSL